VTDGIGERVHVTFSLEFCVEKVGDGVCRCMQ